MATFKNTEQLRQTDFFSAFPSEHIGYKGSPYRLQKSHPELNLSPSAREALAYFAHKEIVWHEHSNHALSSQVCCLNFLFPLATRPETLARFVQGAIGGDMPEMLPLSETRDGTPLFVDFEWLGARDYLNEWPKRGLPKRGANVTSIDALVRFHQGGRQQALLIEWKYTEDDAGPLSDKPPKVAIEGRTYGNATRRKRYEALVFDPDGPIGADHGLALDDFFFHPFYQLLRQQMFARRMEDDPLDPAQRVRLLHIAPAANKHVRRIKAPALLLIARELGTDDAFAVFKHLLKRPDDFISGTTESLFAPLIAAFSADDSWANYLGKRYLFLSDPIAQNSNEMTAA